MRRRLRVGVLLAAVLSIGVAAVGPAHAQSQQAGAASATATSRYIVTVNPALGDVLSVVEAAIAPLGGQVQEVFQDAINGAVVTLPIAVLPSLLNVPGILSVEADGIKTASATQTSPPWGLDRTDQRDRPLSGSYSYNSTGAGVTAYVIDTGLRTSHQQFGTRAHSGFDAIDGGTADDCHGHGTHVAGTIGGSTYGIAKGVDLVGVRVLDCAGSGTDSQVIAGINWVIQDHAAGEPAVANMSLGGSASGALDTAVRNLIADGVSLSVAAGNDSADACGGSPSRVSQAITVAASDINDAMASFSNRGPCVDIVAPGVSVLSSWSSSDTATNTISGTSMATPHVAGVAARTLQAYPTATPAQVASAIVNAASVNKLSGTARTCLIPILNLLCTPATVNKLLFIDPSV